MDWKEPYPNLTDADLDLVIADWILAELERGEAGNAGMVVTDLGQMPSEVVGG